MVKERQNLANIIKEGVRSLLFLFDFLVWLFIGMIYVIYYQFDNIFNLFLASLLMGRFDDFYQSTI